MRRARRSVRQLTGGDVQLEVQAWSGCSIYFIYYIPQRTIDRSRVGAESSEDVKVALTSAVSNRTGGPHLRENAATGEARLQDLYELMDGGDRHARSPGELLVIR